MKAIRGFLLLLFTASILISCSLLSGTIFAVDSGAIKVPQDYSTIQGAINAADPGDTILVSTGTYHEKVWVNKSVSLIGEGAHSTCVRQFLVRADNVTINGFTTEMSVGPSIELTDSDGCNISNNIAYGLYYAVNLYNSRNNFIGDNEVSCQHGERGITLYYYSDNNIIRGNYVENGPLGTGISLVACFNNLVEQNEVVNFYGGIMAYYSDCNVIQSNIIENCETGIILEEAKDNDVFHNNLINNHDQAVDAGRNAWDNGAEGNYWDNYNGTDLDGDGIGDTYLPWEGVDYYPLMALWSPVRTFYVVVNETVYPVTVHSNSTIASFDFNHSLRLISFNATGPQDTMGFCNITILKVLLNGRFLVLVNEETAECTVAESRIHSSVYFTYTHSTRKIKLVEYNTPILGDINYDGKVSLYDIVMAAAAYGSTPEDPDWNPIADVAPQYGIIDIYDLVTIASHYGETY
ncbi:right-handed parallel beta-helix repeat-containing protein [Candidatus Bathyarchaeota archaeon]|nr:right-handed parallel beta-helix repeat-containing protein [Candidatus Bathyarchaeota archaeon]